MSGDLKIRGGFGVREGRLEKAGDATITHQHNFDHMTYLMGPARVEELTPTQFDGDAPSAFAVVRSIDKPSGGYVHIPAGKWHRLTALADNVAYHCLFVHRNPYGEIVDEFDGWAPGYE